PTAHDLADLWCAHDPSTDPVKARKTWREGPPALEGERTAHCDDVPPRPLHGAEGEEIPPSAHVDRSGVDEDMRFNCCALPCTRRCSMATGAAQSASCSGSSANDSPICSTATHQSRMLHRSESHGPCVDAAHVCRRALWVPSTR